MKAELLRIDEVKSPHIIPKGYLSVWNSGGIYFSTKDDYEIRYAYDWVKVSVNRKKGIVTLILLKEPKGRSFKIPPYAEIKCHLRYVPKGRYPFIKIGDVITFKYR